jgi:hypothetical protein
VLRAAEAGEVLKKGLKKLIKVDEVYFTHINPYQPHQPLSTH